MLVQWAFSLLGTFCEFGEMVTKQYDKFYDELCRINWYLLPIEIRKILIIVLIETQRPTIIKGYGNIPCTREAFKMVYKLFCSSVFFSIDICKLEKFII